MSVLTSRPRKGKSPPSTRAACLACHAEEEGGWDLRDIAEQVLVGFLYAFRSDQRRPSPTEWSLKLGCVSILKSLFPPAAGEQPSPAPPQVDDSPLQLAAYVAVLAVRLVKALEAGRTRQHILDKVERLITKAEASSKKAQQAERYRVLAEEFMSKHQQALQELQRELDPGGNGGSSTGGSGAIPRGGISNEGTPAVLQVDPCRPSSSSESAAAAQELAKSSSKACSQLLFALLYNREGLGNPQTRELREGMLPRVKAALQPLLCFRIGTPPLPEANDVRPVTADMAELLTRLLRALQAPKLEGWFLKEGRELVEAAEVVCERALHLEAILRKKDELQREAEECNNALTRLMVGPDGSRRPAAAEHATAHQTLPNPTRTRGWAKTRRSGASGQRTSPCSLFPPDQPARQGLGCSGPETQSPLEEQPRERVPLSGKTAEGSGQEGESARGKEGDGRVARCETLLGKRSLNGIDVASPGAGGGASAKKPNQGPTPGALGGRPEQGEEGTKGKQGGQSELRAEVKVEEDQLVTIGMQYDAAKEAVMYKVRPRILLRKVLEKYSAKVGGGPEAVLYNDLRRVNQEKSIGELSLKDGTVLRCHFSSIAASGL